ncbi:MAG TPA: T9SS type A sorting domain-containing protein [Rubricoccaceae bacterium]|nr:T9SS type A sorting domain-containing protein [Rubricoccaceae bacterium]
MRIASLLLLGLLVGPGVWAQALDTTPQPLPFAQNWTNNALITVDDDWSGVPGVIGYRGDNLTAATGARPDTILADGSTSPVDVNANRVDPNTFISGGVSEFHKTQQPSLDSLNSVVALQGSGTADAPHIVVTVNTTNYENIAVSYNLRDIDGSADNAVQPVALQYRIGMTGAYTNVPAGFVADATTGPSLATLITPVNAVLPAAANNQPVVQIRMITANAIGNDEWVGVDDIQVVGMQVPVELVRFDATTSGRDVTLAWETASETNNAGFEVQMLRGDAWTVLAFVEGHGTTTEAQAYAYTAQGLLPGTHSFRLRQVDFDGAFAYSPEVEATVGVPGSHLLTEAYPNPFNPQATFTLSVAQGQHVRVALYDALGREVAVLFDGEVEADQARAFTIDGSGLPSGLYVYRAVGEGFADAGRVMLVK